MKAKEHVSYECPAGCKHGKIQSVKGERTCNTCKGMGRILRHQMSKYTTKL